jgi:hypothetical protein
VGEIVHLYPGWQKAFYTAESDWMITFPADAESVHKALLIGACQLSKFFFFPGHVCGLAWAISADMVHCEFGALQKGYISVQV